MRPVAASPAWPPNGTHDLQLWLVDLAELSDDLLAIADANDVLSDDEIAWGRGASRDSPHRHRLASRAALRLLLHRAGASRPFKRALSYTRNGKPRLEAGNLEFNVAHSGHRALIALGTTGPIGIDLEVDRPVRIGGPRRQQFLAACDALTGASTGSSARLDADENRRLVTGWTYLEALAKARGSGIGRLLTELGLTAAGVRVTSAAEITARTRVLVAESGLYVASLNLDVGQSAQTIGLHGAVAVPAGRYAHPPVVKALDAGICRELQKCAEIPP